MNFNPRHAVALVATALLCALPSAPAMADTGSAAFDRYVQDLGQRMQAAHDGSYWISTLGDEGAFERYLAAIGRGAAGPGLTDTATTLASLDAKPLRTFDAYLTYLGRRMLTDAGPPGALLGADKGTRSFDRYIEEVNYRIQSLYQAEDATGF